MYVRGCALMFIAMLVIGGFLKELLSFEVKIADSELLTK
jgi:hypothetical protein